MPEALQAAATPNQALWYSHTLAGAKVILSGPSCFQPRAVQKEVVALQAQSSVLQSLARAGHAGLSPLNWAQRLQDSSNSQSQPGSLYRMPLVLGGLCICGGDPGRTEVGRLALLLYAGRVSSSQGESSPHVANSGL